MTQKDREGHKSAGIHAPLYQTLRCVSQRGGSGKCYKVFPQEGGEGLTPMPSPVTEMRVEGWVTVGSYC